VVRDGGNGSAVRRRELLEHRRIHSFAEGGPLGVSGAQFLGAFVDRDGDGGPGGPKRITATANSDIKSLENAENEAIEKMTNARRAWVNAGKPNKGAMLTAMRDATTAFQTAMSARKGYLERLGLPYTEKNIPAKKAYRQEFGLEPKAGRRAAPRPTGGGRILSSTPIK